MSKASSGSLQPDGGRSWLASFYPGDVMFGQLKDRVAG